MKLLALTMTVIRAAAAAALLATGTLLTAKTPADRDLARLLEEDQAERSQDPSQHGLEAASAFARRDRIRRTRAALFLLNDEVEEPEAFSNAALLFQHGDQADDYLVARELALLAASRGYETSLPALAEDRLLLHLKRGQRFGTQYEGIPPSLSRLQRGPWTPHEGFRAEFAVPPLRFARAWGPAEAFEKAVPFLRAYRGARRQEPEPGSPWLTDPARSSVRIHLAKLAPQPPSQVLRRLCRLYHLGGIWLPADYAAASERLLAAARHSSHFLMANEWAALAIMRGHAQAWPLFARSWDLFAVSTGLQPRYGTRPEAALPSSSVAPAVLRCLGKGPPPRQAPRVPDTVSGE